MIDPTESADEMLELRPETIARMLGVKYRSAYKHIQKNNWEKIEGFQGTVKYVVPKSYITEYLENMKKDKIEETGQGSVIVPSISDEMMVTGPIIDYENDWPKNEKLQRQSSELSEEGTVIENLKKELEETNQKLITVTVDLRLSQKDNETYSLLMKEKEKRIAQLEDQVSQEKEHIQAEKSRADMASNQLMNANALIKRRDDAPAQIVEPLESIEALQSRIKELETQPWWRKIIK